MKKVLIAGGSGLIGQKLSQLLLSNGDYVGILSRREKESDKIQYHHWDLDKNQIDQTIVQYDYVINLTGAGIADQKWSEKRKKEIIESRVKSAQLLAETFKNKKEKLKAFVNASAIGYYGDSGEKILTEETPIQTDEFLSKVCDLWENSAQPMADLSERFLIIRIGTVLAKNGGALAKMVAPIKLGMANYLGNGQQWMSWIHIDDICEMIIYLLQNEKSDGIYNGVSPNPTRNTEFTKRLRSVINKFSVLLPAPAFSIKTIFGELSRLVLNSNKVSAQKILNDGFIFKYPELENALNAIYKK